METGNGGGHGNGNGKRRRPWHGSEVTAMAVRSGPGPEHGPMKLRFGFVSGGWRSRPRCMRLERPVGAAVAVAVTGDLGCAMGPSGRRRTISHALYRDERSNGALRRAFAAIRRTVDRGDHRRSSRRLRVLRVVNEDAHRKGVGGTARWGCSAKILEGSAVGVCFAKLPHCLTRRPIGSLEAEHGDRWCPHCRSGSSRRRRSGGRVCRGAAGREFTDARHDCGWPLDAPAICSSRADPGRLQRSWSVRWFRRAARPGASRPSGGATRRDARSGRGGRGRG